MPSLVVKVFLPNDSLSRLVFESIPKWTEVQKKAATQNVDLDDYKINWKDSDGDLIPVNSQSDFAEALANARGDVLRLFAKEKGQERKKDNDASQEALAAMLKHLKDEKDPTLYKGYFCFNCEEQIRGVMFQCLHCDESVSVCQKCEQKGFHKSHPLLKLRSVVQAARFGAFDS